PPGSPLFPYTTLFRSRAERVHDDAGARSVLHGDGKGHPRGPTRMNADLRERAVAHVDRVPWVARDGIEEQVLEHAHDRRTTIVRDRKSTRLNSSHVAI